MIRLFSPPQQRAPGSGHHLVVGSRWSNATIVLVLAPVALLVVWLATSRVTTFRSTETAANLPLLAPRLQPDDWPGWRGVHQNGIAASDRLPLSWSTAHHMEWRVPLPGCGRSSPIVSQERIWLTTSEPNGPLQLVSLNRDTGKPMTATVLCPRAPGSTHSTIGQPSAISQPASEATPVSDGEFLFVPFVRDGELCLTAIDHCGGIRWQTTCGPAVNRNAYAASPALAGNAVIVAMNHRPTGLQRLATTSYLTAIHRKTGERLWRVARPAGECGSVPVVAETSGCPQVLIAGLHRLDAYDPTCGEPLWHVTWTGDRPETTLTVNRTHAYLSSRHPQPLVMCIATDGTGDITATRVAWRSTRVAAGRAAPLCLPHHLLLLEDDGLISSLDPLTGTLQWRKRLAGTFSASPVLAGDVVYCTNEAGRTFVVRPSAEGEIVADSLLPGSVLASPAVSGNRLILRTLSEVYSLRESGHGPIVLAPPPGTAIR